MTDKSFFRVWLGIATFAVLFWAAVITLIVLVLIHFGIL